MNLVIIGGKNPQKLAYILYSNFDDMSIISYGNILEFMSAISVRALDLHRMLLLQDGIDSTVVEDDNDVYNFADIIAQNYPAMKMITICKDTEMVSFLASLFPGPNCAHFCITTLKAKVLADLASLDIGVLNRKYANLRYVPEKQTSEEVIEEIPKEEQMVIPNEQVEGFIPRTQPVEEKRGFFGKVFGLKPKEKKNQLVSGNQKQNIGQGYGVEEFSQPVENPFEMGQPEQEDSSEDNLGYDIFNMDNANDIGLGFIPENLEQDDVHNIMDKYNKEEDNRPHVDLTKYDEPQDTNEEDEDNIGMDMPDLDKFFDNPMPEDVDENNQEMNDMPPFEEPQQEEYRPVLDLNIEEKPQEYNEPVEETPIVAPQLDISRLKKTLEDAKIDVNPEEFKKPIVVPVVLEDSEDEDINLFGDDLNALMQDYEEKNKQIVEREVVKEVVKVVNTGGTSSFRGKNGIRTLIVTGDRRVGVTKLSLNLAGLFARNEKVLYVDFDRYRHGSLGYLDLDNMLEEEEHIQNGVNHLKGLNILNNVVHTYRKGGFYTLTSMYGTDVSDEEMMLAQSVLAKQQEFTTVIIDCPIENIYLLKDIVYNSRVLICSEDDKIGILNLITMLGSCCNDNRFLSAIYNNAYFVVGRRGNIDKFQRVLYDVLDMFDIEDYDWNNIEVIGTLKDTNMLAGRLDV